jgi:hypothetical protein
VLREWRRKPSTKQSLVPLHERGRRTGLAHLLHKETRAWWASRRWLVQSLLWISV